MEQQINVSLSFSQTNKLKKKIASAGRNLKDLPDRIYPFLFPVSVALFADNMLYYNLLAYVYQQQQQQTPYVALPKHGL